MKRTNLRKRSSFLVPGSALIVMVSVSACLGERPTFVTPRAQDAGGSGGDSEVDAAGDHGSHDETADAEASSTATEDVPDASNYDDTAPADTDQTETEGMTSSGQDTDAGADSNATSNDGGGECPSGRYAADDGQCQAWTECAPGTYISAPGSVTSDQRCGPCEEGTYSDVPNAAECTPWDHCGWFETSKAGTDTSNAECLQADRFHQFGTEGADGIGAIAADTTGSVVVVGGAGGALYDGAKGKAFVRLYNSHGEVEWTRQFGEANQDEVDGVSFQPGGDVMIAGSTNVVAGADNPVPDAFVARLASSDGEEVWREQFGTGYADRAVAIATDAYDTSAVVGMTEGGLSQNNLGRADVIVRLYGGTGEEHWTRQFGTVDEDTVTGVAIGPLGHVAIVGHTSGDLGGESAGGQDGFLRVYTSDGSSHKTTQFGGEHQEYAEAVAFTPSGDIAVVGYAGGCVECMTGFLRLYQLEDDGGLRLLRVRTIGSYGGIYPSAVFASRSGNIVVAGHTLVALWADVRGWIDGFVQQYDDSGELLGGRQFGTDGTDGVDAFTLVGAKEHVLVAGSTDGDLSGVNAGGSDAFVGIIDMASQMQ